MSIVIYAPSRLLLKFVDISVGVSVLLSINGHLARAYKHNVGSAHSGLCSILMCLTTLHIKTRVIGLIYLAIV